jgi:hypothetical protein
MIFLTRLELAELTGYKQAKRQIDQLKAMRIPYRVNGRGHPVVAKDQVTGAAYAPQTTWSPDVVTPTSAPCSAAR